MWSSVGVLVEVIINALRLKYNFKKYDFFLVLWKIKIISVKNKKIMS